MTFQVDKMIDLKFSLQRHEKDVWVKIKSFDEGD